MTETVESIRLDSLDGFQFEELCKRIFEKLGLGKVTYLGHVSDEGRDLILQGYKRSKAIVECKHWPNGIVGRPIIQKLHSATVSSDAKYAIAITTGHFSKEAIDQARKLEAYGVTVELIDLPILTNMARQAGISILHKGQSFPIRTTHVSELNQFPQRIRSTVFNRPVISAPQGVESIFSIQPTNLELKAAYLVRFNIHQNFETSIGRIFSIHDDDRSILVNGENGEKIEDQTSATVLSSTWIEGIPSGHTGIETRIHEFKIDLQSLTSRVKHEIINIYTKNVSYRGRNNVGYTKTCQPSERSIFISSITELYYPHWTIRLNALTSHYQMEVIENHRQLLITLTDIYKCRQCERNIGDYEKTLLCNACGAIVHRKKSHGFICKYCQKTICRSCTFWTRRILFFKRKICETCADKRASIGKRKRKLDLGLQ